MLTVGSALGGMRHLVDTAVGVAGEASLFGTESARIQQVFGTSSLTGLQVGDRITGISFRLDQGQFLGLPAQSVADFSVTLSTAKFGPGLLSMNFGENVGSDAVTVRQGMLTIGAGDYAAGGNPGNFGATISFDTPFSYQGGALLLDISHSGLSSGGAMVDAHTSMDAHVLFGSVGAVSAREGLNGAGVVVNLRVEQVPEPSTYLLLAFGSSALALNCRWMKRGMSWHSVRGLRLERR